MIYRCTLYRCFSHALSHVCAFWFPSVLAEHMFVCLASSWVILSCSVFVGSSDFFRCSLGAPLELISALLGGHFGLSRGPRGASWGKFSVSLGFGGLGRGPKAPPKGPRVCQRAPQKYSQRCLGASWPILRRDFSQNGPPSLPPKGSQNSPEHTSQKKHAKM